MTLASFGPERELVAQSSPDRLSAENIEEIFQWEQNIAQPLPRIHFQAGETIITKGDTGRDVYILLRGKILVIIEPEQEPLELSGRGVFFGEIAALFEGVRRTADVVAKDEEVLAIRISYEELTRWNGGSGVLGRSHKIITDTAADRIRQMTGAQARKAGFPWAQDLTPTSQGVSLELPTLPPTTPQLSPQPGGGPLTKRIRGL